VGAAWSWSTWAPTHPRHRSSTPGDAHDDVLTVAIGSDPTTASNPARHIATLLHDELPGIPVFIGGPAITGEREARALGADEYGATALDVAVRCIELAAG
jgi:hypothetical protein